MEEKIYERQINKLALAGRVVDEQQISRHFTDEEIKELYAFTAEEYVEGGNVPVPQLPAVSTYTFICYKQLGFILKHSH